MTGSGERTVEVLRLPGTEWHVWRDAVLRTTGFPADGLRRLAAPDAAAAADAYLAGRLDAAGFAAAFEKATADISRQLYEIAGDPRFVEAITWQNTNVLHALDGLRASGPAGRRNYRRRSREEIVARYWQRYCAKNDTIGFFGPVCWVQLADDGQAVQGDGPGPAFVRHRTVYFERWALAAFARHLAKDPAVREWLPVAVQPQLTVDGRTVRRPVLPPLPLSPAETALLARLPRPRAAATLAADLVAAELAGEPAGGFRKPADVYLVLDQLVEGGILRWGIDLPVDLTAEQALRDALAAIGDDDVRRTATDAFDRLDNARRRVAAAAGDPAALRAAMAALDREFSELTGSAEVRHRPGEIYVGRALCHEDTVRDLSLTFGRPLLTAIAPPLDILLHAARWLTETMADAYHKAFRELYDDLCADLGTPDVPLADLRYLAYGLIFGGGERPVDAVTDEFVRRWSVLFGLPDVPPGTRRLRFASAELADRVRDAFPAEGPGWSGGRIHSPDLQIAAPSQAALARGEFTVVLGELHAAFPTCSSAIFHVSHPDPATLSAAIDRDLGVGRVQPLHPEDFPRITARVADMVWSPASWQLAYEPAPGVDHDRLLPVTALTVSDVDGQLVARRQDGQSWPLVEIFGAYLSLHAADAFKLVSCGPHTPRITIDNLVAVREAWRTTVGATGIGSAVGYAGQYLAARRWRAALDLPERVFVRVGTELKPTYLDLTSPALVSSFANMLRRARADGGEDVPLMVTELLPTLDDTWVPDAEGRRYYSELRLHVRDPRPAPFVAAVVPPGGRRD